MGFFFSFPHFAKGPLEGFWNVVMMKITIGHISLSHLVKKMTNSHNLHMGSTWIVES
jgi:hypothetical protein